MSRVKFIDFKYITENTTINENVDEDLIIPLIIKVQDTKLQQVLGTSLYDRLKQGVIDDDLNADEKTLLDDWIRPMVGEWVYYESVDRLIFKFTNKSVSKERSEYSDASTIDEARYIKSGIRDLAEFYTKRLVKYLCDNESKFPEFCDGDENLKPSRRAYFTGVYIPGRKKKSNDPYHDKY